jgi:hypothetical protein
MVPEPPPSIAVAGIAAIALAAATGDSTSPMLTRVAMNNRVMGMRFSLFDARFASLAYCY